MKLYKYQEDAVEALNNGKHICIAGTGAGKGAIMLHWLHSTGKKKCLVITMASKRDSHDIENEADMWFPGWRQSQSSFTVLSWQGLAKWWNNLDNRRDIDEWAIAFDECLPADTKVKTDKGEVEIADLKVGDKVLSYNEKTGKTEFKTITRTIKKKAPEIMYRHRSHNGAIIATGNHPHYIGDGYAKAETIKQGDFLYEYKGTRDSLQDKEVWRKKTMCNLWKGNSNQRLDSTTDTTDFKRQDLLFKGMWNEDGQTEIFGTHVCEQSDEERDINLESSKDKSGAWVQTSLGKKSRTKRWKREDNETTRAIVCRAGKDKQRMGYGATSRSKIGTWVSKVLQAGHWERLLQGRSGMRWGEPQFEERKIEGQEKRGEIKPVRVESVEVLKLRDIKKSKLYRNPDYVYCIDVEDNHNFFANGFLTHNCHCAKAGVSSQRGKAFINITKRTTCWTGYTATPGEKWIEFYPYFVADRKITTKSGFLHQFCNVQTFKGYPEIVDYYHEDVLKQWWGDVSDTVDTSEMLRDMPAESEFVKHFKMPKHYKEVARTRIGLDGEMLDTTMGYCHALRQLCASKEKLDWVSDFLEGLETNAVIFYNYIEEGNALAEVCKKQGRKVWRIGGGEHNIPTASTIGKKDIVLCQWVSGSASLNLQFMNYWVAFTPNYGYATTVQAKGRIKRIGQTKPMFFYWLRCDGTIEDAIYKCLHNKEDFAAEVWAMEQ